MAVFRRRLQLSQRVRSVCEKLRILHLVLLLDFHVHEDFDAGLDVVDQREPVELLELLLLVLEELFVVVVDFFVGTDLDGEVQLKNRLLERGVRELERFLLLEEFVVGEEVEVSVAIFAVLFDVGG